MKLGFSFLLLVSGLLPMFGCGKSLPDAYGVYADTNHGQILLQGQGVHVVGNMLRPIPGLSGPSGPECGSVKEFVVYEKDVPT